MSTTPRTLPAYGSAVRRLATEVIAEAEASASGDLWDIAKSRVGAWSSWVRDMRSSCMVLAISESRAAAQAAEEAYHQSTNGSLGGMLRECAIAAMVEDVLAECDRISLAMKEAS